MHETARAYNFFISGQQPKEQRTDTDQFRRKAIRPK